MWELIRANERKSAVLIILMGILLAGMGFVIGMAFDAESGAIWGIILSLAVWGLLMLISFTAGKDIMLSTSGAKQITPDMHPQLYNVVEEMRIAAGMNTTPKVYIIDTEMPNAFATGMKPENSAVAVTSGLLRRLNRDELQGVVAHEMSHIINRDIRFMTIAGVMMGTIIIIAQVFLRGMFFSGGGRRDSKGGSGQIIFLLIAIAFAILAPIMARLLYFAISRKREYLADASAVRLTRYPEGLASALEKIASSDAQIPSANKVTAPMYICNPLRPKGMKAADLSSTHPPISERIRILRNMSGGANYINYQQAYQSVRNQSSLLPASALADHSDIPLRDGGSEGIPGAELKTNTRAATDAVLMATDYTLIDCNCGMKLKVPPQYSGKYVYCTRCGMEHKVKR